jgi:hypothetical protein
LSPIEMGEQTQIGGMTGMSGASVPRFVTQSPGTVVHLNCLSIAKVPKGVHPMKRQLTLLVTVALLAGCGTTQPERTSGGAATGAATGAGVGALGGPPGMAVGALVGAGAGAATGAATKPNEVNLGKPPWTNPETRVPGSGQATSTAQLNDRSYEAAHQGSNFNP